MTWRIRLAEREQRIAKLEREIERLQRIEDLRRVTLVTNETCACQHLSVPAGMRRPLSPTADTPSRTSVAVKCPSQEVGRPGSSTFKPYTRPP